MTASLNDVNPELKSRILGMQSEAPGAFWVTCGHRPIPEQWNEWNRWQKDIEHWGSAEKAIARGCAIAAYPGTSMHGHNPADAVDLACAPDGIQLRKELAHKWGLCQPIPSEGWHLQLDPNRKPMVFPPPPAPPSEDDMTIKKIACPTGGYWILKLEDGGVSGQHGAPELGNLSGKNAARAVDLTPFVVDGVVHGYWIVTADGAVYSFGDAPFLGGANGHPEWHIAPVLGLTQTGGFHLGETVTYAVLTHGEGDGEYEVHAYDLPLATT